METLTEITRFGLPGIDRMPMGMHACHFFADREELQAALIPYFLAGLQANEKCLWITAPPLVAPDAIASLFKAFPEADTAAQNGALRVLDFDQLYLDSAALKGTDVIALWLEEEERALREGYTALRISGNTSFLKGDGWSAFMDYEREITIRFNGRRIVTLCSYVGPQCDHKKKGEVMKAHHCSLERGDPAWQVVLPEAE